MEGQCKTLITKQDIDKTMIIDRYNFHHDVCAQFFLDNPVEIRGSSCKLRISSLQPLFQVNGGLTNNFYEYVPMWE